MIDEYISNLLAETGSLAISWTVLFLFILIIVAIRLSYTRAVSHGIGLSMIAWLLAEFVVTSVLSVLDQDSRAGQSNELQSWAILYCAYQIPLAIVPWLIWFEYHNCKTRKDRKQKDLEGNIDADYIESYLPSSRLDWLVFICLFCVQGKIALFLTLSLGLLLIQFLQATLLVTLVPLFGGLS